MSDASALVLEIEDSKGRIRHVELTKKYLVIGRGSDTGLRIRHVMVSRQHAVIRMKDGAEALLKDLGSRNGTRVGGEKIKSGKPVSIKVGEGFEIWNLRFRVRSSDELGTVEVEEAQEPDLDAPASLEDTVSGSLSGMMEVGSNDNGEANELLGELDAPASAEDILPADVEDVAEEIEESKPKVALRPDARERVVRTPEPQQQATQNKASETPESAPVAKSSATPKPSEGDNGEAAQQLLLEIEDSKGRIRHLSLSNKHLVIGRGNDTGLRIRHMMVSRQHATIYMHKPGEARLKDLGSRNGVRIGGKKIKAGKFVTLRPGDGFDIWNMHFRIRANEEIGTLDVETPQEPDLESPANLDDTVSGSLSGIMDIGASDDGRSNDLLGEIESLESADAIMPSVSSARPDSAQSDPAKETATAAKDDSPVVPKTSPFVPQQVDDDDMAFMEAELIDDDDHHHVDGNTNESEAPATAPSLDDYWVIERGDHLSHAWSQLHEWHALHLRMAQRRTLEARLESLLQGISKTFHPVESAAILRLRHPAVELVHGPIQKDQGLEFRLDPQVAIAAAYHQCAVMSRSWRDELDRPCAVAALPLGGDWVLMVLTTVARGQKDWLAELDGYAMGARLLHQMQGK